MKSYILNKKYYSHYCISLYYQRIPVSFLIRHDFRMKRIKHSKP